MAYYFSMPKLGMNMTEGTLVHWYVQEGETVEAGQPLLDVETDKAVNTIDAPAGGILARIVKAEGETVPCTFVLAVLTQPGESLSASIPEAIADGVRPKSEVEVKVGSESQADAPDASEAARRVSISPSAKLLAKELGVDISKIVPQGDRIQRKDVEDAYAAMQAGKGKPGAAPAAPTAAPAPSGPAARRRPMTLLRRRIAEKMSLSARSVARVGLTLEADASALVAWREQLRQGGLQAGYSELFVKLAALALREFPYMNARLEGEELVELEAVNVGVAVDVEGGLMVPVVHGADGKTPAGIHAELAEKVERARLGRSLSSDLEGGTFTITNLGTFEIEQFLPVINVPECAILGIGAIVRKPVAVEDRVEIRPRVTLTLAFDHRLVDGAPAARFLQRVKQLLENPPA